MKKILTAAVAVVAFLTALSPAPAGAEAHPNTSLLICSGSAVPTGWMITGYSDSNTCGTPGQFLYDAKTITDVSGTPAGGTVRACQGPAPAGFYAVSLSYSFSCENSKTPDGLLNNQQNVENLNGLPTGTTVTICGEQAAPAGWVTISIEQSYLCVLSRNGGVGDNAIQIHKL